MKHPPLTSSVLIVISVAGIVSTLASCNQPQVKTETVFYSSRDIPIAQTVAPDDVEEKQLETSKIPADAVRQISLAIGRFSRGLKKGELITTRNVVSTGEVINEILPSVVYATQNIPAGFYLDPESLQEKATDLKDIPNHIFECNKETFKNSFAQNDIKKGQMLSWTMFTPETGKHCFFATRDVAKDAFLTRKDLQLKDPATPDIAKSVAIEKLLTNKLKKKIKRGEQLTIDAIF